MVKVIFEDASGRTVEAEGQVGESVMRVALNANIEGIDADCGGACSCATCHVTVAKDWVALVGPAGATEADMIEFEGECTPASRLACQVMLTAAMDGLAVSVVPRG